MKLRESVREVHTCSKLTDYPLVKYSHLPKISNCHGFGLEDDLVGSK